MEKSFVNSLLKHMNQNVNHGLGEILRFTNFNYIYFDDLRTDFHFNKYLKQFDERKINKSDQSSYLCPLKLQKLDDGKGINYAVIFGNFTFKTMTNDDINEKFQLLRDNNLLFSEAIRLKIYFKDAVKMNHNKYKAITELIYYFNNEKVAMYYISVFKTN